uniref:Uncharacterized protein n=1 Tax=Anguilla anguilla TaxID=7936 RepID=A0A0E9T6H5_ANGAN
MNILEKEFLCCHQDITVEYTYSRVINM